ncbi:Zinc finger CCCH domain-containing protein 30 [Abeliophyllum distichum]|uniref:Zinc finger CCCH domain-containing protein 30 n=1 Tax=Abeliophyllum distichum TaxID=126358 RepID=A0ABD1VER7_9LAMI
MNDNRLNVETEDAFAGLLELAANNDIEGFKRSVDREPSSIDEVGLWYGHQKGSKQMVFHQRTPLMVAATYGSLDVLKLIISSPEVDVNRSSGVDKSTALHCAASGGSVNAVDVVKLLLAAGADPNLADANGCCPVDVITVPPKFQETKFSLEMILRNDASFGELSVRVSTTIPNSVSPPLSPSPRIGSPSSPSELVASPKSAKFASEKKEYPIDPSLPDIKNSIYSTDEFRMFSFKVRPCSRAYSHDWTECPFVHPGENARRRDPRKYHYSCVPCPDFRKGACRRGDMCEYAHGVFECWLHPAQYRTRLCKDGMSCNRRVCFFAHAQEELRPLYVSTGSAVLSPRSSSSAANAMDFATAMSLLPGSPSSPFTPPMSPSTNGMSNMGWPQQNVPALHLPGSNLQSSRLRTSLNARDFPPEDLSLLQDFDTQHQQKQFLNELSRLSQPTINANSLNHSARSKTLIPSNLEDAFSVECSSPRYTDPSVFSPTHKSALLNQFQQQQQNVLSSS